MFGFNGFFSARKEDKYDKIVEIYNLHRDIMLRVAMAILKDEALAEDSVAECLEKMLKNVDKIGDATCHKTKSYIVIMVRNTSINILKKQKRTDTLSDSMLNNIPDDSMTALDALISMEGLQDIIDIFETLPQSLRDAAVLSFYHEHSHCEIAEELGISETAVRQRVSRARKAIRQILSGGGSNDE